LDERTTAGKVENGYGCFVAGAQTNEFLSVSTTMFGISASSLRDVMLKQPQF